jgi:apolipoprotein N-acyltransferase
MNDNRWLLLLKAHYSAPLSVSFKQFRLGAMLFFLGGVLIYLANAQLSPSAAQEATVLAGIIIGGCGFVWAMLAQMRMLISRIVRFFQE